jgi:formate C-acetyltransferase
MIQASQSDRIPRLRRRVLERKDAAALGRWSWSAVVTAESLRASEGVASGQVRRGLVARDRLRAVRLEVDDLELLAGRLAAGGPAETAAEVRRAEEYLAVWPEPPGQRGHCELDLGGVLGGGIDAVAADIRGRLAAGGGDGERAEAYESFLLALEGLSDMISHAAEVATAATAGAGSPARRAELAAMAESCRRVAHSAPATFRDAIQLLWLVDLAVMHADRVWLVGPGHIDRTLWPFYQADLAAGRVTPAEALELIECLYLLMNDYIPDGLAIPVMVGGRDAAGRDVTNELSYLCLEAIRRTGLIYPTVGVCWHEGTPGELVHLAVELVAAGYKTPAFFGDQTIQRGLRALGVPAEEACNYVNSTCVEITPVGASNVWVASPYYNTCGLLLAEIAAAATAARAAQPGAAPGAGTEGTFEEFVESYRRRLAEAVAAGVAAENDARRQRRRSGGKPLQSVFTRDCIARGRDIDDGGAVYNWVECSFVGLANLADSLHAVREEVFRQRRTTLAELKAALDADFRGQEALRLRLLNGYAKYGQGCAEVDELVGQAVRFVAATCGQFRMEPDGSPYVPGAFAWVMHEQLGRQTGATPDGRKAGFPFADGCGPAQGREAKGPTAAILSATSWDHSSMIGGLAYNMKFGASLMRSPHAAERLGELVLTFLRGGGFETQINVVDAQTLRKARGSPEQYRDLVVRIGGYCDYFTRLSPQMQEEVILRTEFEGF